MAAQGPRSKFRPHTHLLQCLYLLAGFSEQTALHWRNKEVLLGTIKTWICNIFCASFRRKLPLKGSDSWYGFQGKWAWQSCQSKHALTQFISRAGGSETLSVCSSNLTW